MTLKRTFKADGYGRDREYMFAVVNTWVGLGTEGLALRAARLQTEEMHDADRDLLRRIYKSLFDHAEGNCDFKVFLGLVRELLNVKQGSME